MSLPFRRQNVRNLISEAFCLLFFGLTVFCGQECVDQFTRADQMRRIDIVTRQLLISTLGAESGTRGYIITDDLRYLEPYYTGMHELGGELNTLRQLTVNTTQQSTIEQIDQAVNVKMTQLAIGIKDRPNGFPTPKAGWGTHAGKQAMDTIRTQIDELELWSIFQYRNHEVQATLYARLGFAAMLVSIFTGLYLVIKKE